MDATSKESIEEFITLHIPNIIKASKKSKFWFVNPFTSNRARIKVIQHLADKLYEELNKPHMITPINNTDLNQDFLKTVEKIENNLHSK